MNLNIFDIEGTFSETNAIQQVFIHILSSRLQFRKNHTYVIPSAINIFNSINILGGWQCCALLKLEYANIAHVNTPKAFAEDNTHRAEIIKVAIVRVK